jgi:hypothetical protein
VERTGDGETVQEFGDLAGSSYSGKGVPFDKYQVRQLVVVLQKVLLSL